MLLDLMHLGAWIDVAVRDEPPDPIREICGEYYQPYYYLMFLLAFNLDVGIAVELGVEKGRGAVSMLITNKHVIGIDNQDRPEMARIKEQFRWFTFLHKASLPVPKEVKKFQDEIVILHIDTEHSYSMAKAEFDAYRPYLHNPAVVLFDDLHAQEDDVLKYFSTLPYPKIQDDRLHPACGYGAMLYVE